MRCGVTSAARATRSANDRMLSVGGVRYVPRAPVCVLGGAEAQHRLGEVLDEGERVR